MQRLLWADALKGWLMLLVIMGHVIQFLLEDGCDSNHLWNYIYSFHMPAFMALSGWLAFRKSPNTLPLRNNFWDIVKRRGQQLLIPYFLWSLISFLIAKDWTIGQFSKIILNPDSYFWFLWTLFWISLLFSVARLVSLRRRVHEDVALSAMGIFLFLAMILFEIRVCGFQFIAYYFLFYLAGFWIHKYDLHLPAAVCAVVALAWMALAWGWSMHGLPSWFPVVSFASLLQYAYRGLTALLAVLVLLQVSPSVLNSPRSINLWAGRFGALSLGVYVCHLTIGSYLLPLVADWAVPYWIKVLIGTLILGALSWAVVTILNKNHITARLLLGKLCG